MQEFKDFVGYLESLRQEKQKRHLQEASIKSITEEIREALKELEEELEQAEEPEGNPLTEAKVDETDDDTIASFAEEVAQTLQKAWETKKQEEMREAKHKKCMHPLAEAHDEDEELELDLDDEDIEVTIEDVDEDGDLEAEIGLKDADLSDDEELDIDVDIKGAVESEEHVREEMDLLHTLLERVEEAIELLRKVAGEETKEMTEAASRATPRRRWESRVKKSVIDEAARQRIRERIKRKLQETRVVKPVAESRTSGSVEDPLLDLERIKRLAGL
jgi:DNA-binding ferritin-like protein